MDVQPFIEEISELVSMSWYGVLYLVYFVLKSLDIIRVCGCGACVVFILLCELASSLFSCSLVECSLA